MLFARGTIVPDRNCAHPKRMIDITDLDCDAIAELAGDGACRTVLQCVCKSISAGDESTVWEIHQITGLPLHEAFAALRTLEYGRIIDIVDNPSDPFGARIRLLLDGIDAMTRRNVA